MTPIIRQTPSSEYFDVVVIGCGPAGATCATHLARAGLRVLALERHQFPRYHIGESLTGIVGAHLAELGLKEEMKRRRFVEKPGVKVIGKDAKSEFFVPVLVPTWQVRRDEFDLMLLENARKAGVEHRYGSVKLIVRNKGRVVGVGYRPEGSHSDELKKVVCKVVVDASGHSAILSRHRVAGPRRVDAFGRQVAVFTQIEGARRDPGPLGGNTVIFYSEKHHWAWFIPLSDTAVSVGVVLPSDTYKRHGTTPEEVMDWGLDNINPDLARRVDGCRQIEPVRFIRNYSYRIDPFVGDGWICIGDAHRFADPIFSFGVAFALAEAARAARAIQTGIQTGSFAEPFREFAEVSERGHDAVFDLIRYFWRYPAFFNFAIKGQYRKDIIRLLAGDVFDAEELPALAAMRKSLSSGAVDQLPEGPAREIGRRVVLRYADFQGIEACYLTLTDDGVLLSFVTSDHDPDLYDAMFDFEERLYRDYGRDRLAILHWARTDDARDVPSFDDAVRLFERKAA